MSSQIDAILGVGTYERPGAPEPSLLPIVTRFASPDSLGFAAYQAELYAADHTTSVPIPALARAVARIIATRARTIENGRLYEAAVSLPLVGALSPLSPVSSAGPELAAHIGARLGSRTLVERAIASAFSPDEMIRATAAGLPLVGSIGELVAATLTDIGSVSVRALGAVTAHIDEPRASQILRAWLASGHRKGTVVAGLVELLSSLGSKDRERAADAALSMIAEGALQSTGEWRMAYIGRRLRETDRGASATELRDLGDSLARPWQEAVSRTDWLEPTDDESALLGSHPYADVVAAGPILRLEADDALNAMIKWWGGASAQQAGVYRSGGDPDELYLHATIDELHGDAAIRRTDGFARGRSHRVAVNLASEALASGVVAGTPVPIDRSLSHELYLSFFAPWLPPTPPRRIVVHPEDEETEKASVEFTVAPELGDVVLTLVLQERFGDALVAIQSGVLAGPVTDPGVAGTGITLTIDPHPARPPEPTIDGVTIALADDMLVVYDGTFSHPGQLRELRASLGDKILELWDAIEGTMDDKELATALVKLAARGNAVLELLHKRLEANDETRHRLFETNEAIRLWSRDLSTDLPVEFIYDGDVRTLNYQNPALCQEFFDGLRATACRECSNHAGTVCAFDFWGMRRRIERRVADDREAKGSRIGGVASTSFLPSLTTPAAFGASNNVSEDSRNRMLALLNAGGANITEPAANWDTWRTILNAQANRLLVLLSHTHDTNELEIGGDLIDRQFLTNQYVNPHGEHPGPVVLLTGCETARPEFSFLSFVSKFLDEGAAVVVGTLALIREDVSAEATRQLLIALRTVVDEETDDDQRTIGEIMRRTRCQLLADQDLTGFNLVAYGDADWRFASAGVL